MSARTILEYPNPVLQQPAAQVDTFDSALEAQIEDLFDTLHDSTGIGLSAPQIGTPLQIVVVDERTADSAPMAFINPKIIAAATPCIVEERCLSLPDLSGHVLRSAEVVVAYQAVDGTRVEAEFSGMSAVCLQHEIDHLEGRLFLERLPRLQQWWYRRRLTRRRAASAA